MSITSLASGGVSGSVVTPFTTPATFAEVANLSNLPVGVDPGDLYLNNIAITPEPAAVLTFALAGFALLGRRYVAA